MKKIFLLTLVSTLFLSCSYMKKKSLEEKIVESSPYYTNFGDELCKRITFFDDGTFLEIIADAGNASDNEYSQIEGTWKIIENIEFESNIDRMIYKKHGSKRGKTTYNLTLEYDIESLLTDDSEYETISTEYYSEENKRLSDAKANGQIYGILNIGLDEYGNINKYAVSDTEWENPLDTYLTSIPGQYN